MPETPFLLTPLYDRVVLASDPPDMVRGVALPDGYNWLQAKGLVLGSNTDAIPVGSMVRIRPGAGERVRVSRGSWVLFVEEWDCLALELDEDD